LSVARWLTATCLTVAVFSADSASGQEGPTAAMLERRALDHATRLDQAGHQDEAMRALENLLEEQPLAASALVLLAQIAEQSGDPGRVLPEAEAAVLLDDSDLAAVRQVWIRALQAAGLQDSALNAARRWTEVEPLEPAAYVELSGVWVRSGDREAAVGALEAGRSAIGSDRLFIQELAALQTERGAYGDAAVEWRAMLAWGDAGAEAVERWISYPGTRRAEAVAALREELAVPETTFLERKGGLHLALLLGQPTWAREIVESLLADLPGPGRAEVLRDYVIRAKASGDLAGAAWAARSLADRGRSRDEILYWTAMTADLAYEAGDVEGARSSFLRLVTDAPPGSDLYGVSLRRLHALTVNDDPEGSETRLQEHRDLYPEDHLASVVMSVQTARAWLKRGKLERARSVVEAVPAMDAGQAALQAGVLGRMEVLAGRPEAARGHLELAAAVPTGQPGGRIEALELLSVVEGSDSASLVTLGNGVVAATASGDSSLLVESVAKWSTERTPGGDGMAVFAAQELEAAGHRLAARTVRIEIVEGWPGSPAAPLTLLALARGEREVDPGQAVVWLERLIVDFPESAMAPVARRLLAELRTGVPRA
jgi:tetratricopeptide (TPR) repeat protein